MLFDFFNSEVICAMSEKKHGNMSVVRAASLRQTNAEVRFNRKKFLTSIGVDFNQVVCPHLVHNSEIAIVNRPDWNFKQVDGVITGENIYIAMIVGDCPVVFLHDERQDILAVAHCGWRGLAKGLPLFIVEKLFNEFSSRPADIKVFLSPCIRKYCYQVREDVVRAFSVWPVLEHSVEKYTLNGKVTFYADLQAACKSFLIKAGIKDDNILTSHHCTACEQSRFFSHRASGGNCGLMMAVFGIRPS